MTTPLKIGVLFGGRSGEHEVSLVSGKTVMAHLDAKRYGVYALGIRRDGAFASPAQTRAMLDGPLPDVVPSGGVVTNSKKGGLLDLRALTDEGETVELDLFFPILHGPFGEDGTMQGFLEMMGRPFVGCGVAVSACGMDKELTKRLLKEAGLPVIAHDVVSRWEWDEAPERVVEKALETVGTPCFVKPCRMGSSVGITRVAKAGAMREALELALRYDYKVLVEAALDVREFECSVMGNTEVEVSHPGEILPSREFYDYSAKYLDGDASKLLIPAPISEHETQTLMDMAKRGFEALGAEGFARVDFLQDKKDGSVYINEINTIPGFTEISMFPKLWSHEGRSISEVLDTLVSLALERHRWKQGLTIPRSTEG